MPPRARRTRRGPAEPCEREKKNSFGMVLTGRSRGHQAFAFASAGCTAACCATGGRQIVTTRTRPLPTAHKIVFILAVNKSFGRRLLPQEVLRRIFELSSSVERTVVKQPPPPVAALGTRRLREQAPELDF